MAKKKNGNATVEEQILEQLVALRQEIRRLREETAKGFASVNSRLDHVVENTGNHWRKLEERVAALERKAG